MIEQLTVDHRPTNEIEMKRILSNGGKIYQTKIGLPIKVPHRVFPGRLSVSRTIGDIEAKYKQFEGNPKVVVADPDIYEYTIDEDDDFLLIGCDGVFDELSNEEIGKYIWSCKDASKSVHDQAADAVDSVLQLAAYKESYDNLTAVLIAFKGFANENERAADIPRIEPVAKLQRVLSNERMKKHLSQHNLKAIIDRKLSIPTMRKINALSSNPFKFPKISQVKKPLPSGNKI
jgi:protein phosphatase 2C family protein 2/3